MTTKTNNLTMNQQLVLRDTPQGLPVKTRVRAGSTHKDAA